ncbi:MAG: caspase family protein [Myxococcota bacterium]
MTQLKQETHFSELLFTRAKDCYVERGYRVVPPVDAPISLTFQAWRGTSTVSVVGVAAVAPLEAVIEAVRKLVDQLAPHERVEGCVVLSSNDPKESERVVQAGLVALPHKELARMGVREVTAFVDRQQAVLVREEADTPASEEDKDLCRDLRAGLRESSARVVIVRTQSVPDSARRIVLSLTRDYLRDPARAAPVLLRFTTQPSDFQELVASAFNERRVPFSRFDFPGLLTESAFLPVFAVDSLQFVMRSDADHDAAFQVLAKGAKVVLVTSEEGSVTISQLARRWNLRARNFRTFSTRASQTKGPARVDPRPPSIEPPRGSTSPRFEQGRALLVGVANYPRISRLPEIVLNDARDIATLLQSPTRCGYPQGNVELLLDGQATAQRFRLGLQRLANDARHDDTVVVFFSGHGARIGTGSDAEAYLLPFDYDPNDHSRTALSTNELTQLLAGIRSSRLVVLFDACHSAGAAYVKTADTTTVFKAGLDDKTYEVLGRGAGRVVMASSRADESSLVMPGMKNSLFTAYLLEALAGDAMNRDDDVIRVLDVFHHIAENVPLKGPQHPILKAQDVENNFPIALNLKTKQAPIVPIDDFKAHSSRNGHAASPLSPKARLAIKKALVRRWDDLADYFGIPLADKARFSRGDEGQGTLDWLEERGRLDGLREAFSYFDWKDLIAVLDRHSR